MKPLVALQKAIAEHPSVLDVSTSSDTANNNSVMSQKSAKGHENDDNLIWTPTDAEMVNNSAILSETPAESHLMNTPPQEQTEVSNLDLSKAMELAVDQLDISAFGDLTDILKEPELDKGLFQEESLMDMSQDEGNVDLVEDPSFNLVDFILSPAPASSPAYTPSTPVYAPSTPAYAPATPAYSATTPVYAPTPETPQRWETGVDTINRHSCRLCKKQFHSKKEIDIHKRLKMCPARSTVDRPARNKRSPKSLFNDSMETSTPRIKKISITKKVKPLPSSDAQIQNDLEGMQMPKKARSPNANTAALSPEPHGTWYNLPDGWKKLVQPRKTVSSNGSNSSKYDVYVTTPDGKRLRSNSEILRWILENPECPINPSFVNIHMPSDPSGEVYESGTQTQKTLKKFAEKIELIKKAGKAGFEDVRARLIEVANSTKKPKQPSDISSQENEDPQTRKLKLVQYDGQNVSSQVVSLKQISGAEDL